MVHGLLYSLFESVWCTVYFTGGCKMYSAQCSIQLCLKCIVHGVVYSERSSLQFSVKCIVPGLVYVVCKFYIVWCSHQFCVKCMVHGLM